MQQLMDTLRKNPPEKIAGAAVLLVEDYESGIRHHTESHKTEKLTLPQSDVLLLRLSDESRIVIRPSGTEPKIKIYASARQPFHERAIAECDARLDTLLNAVTHLLS
jgi:phosphoglucomutase